MITYLDKIINIYNDNFCNIIIVISLFFIITGINIVKNENDRKKCNFLFILKENIVKMTVMLILWFAFVIFIKEAFSINIFGLSDFSRYWKILVSIWIAINFVKGKKLYNDLNFYALLEEIKEGENDYTSLEHIMLKMIDNYCAGYALEVEKIGILKCLAPISLIPLIAGYIVEGKDIKVNWNWYTVVFFGGLFVYIYNFWKSYKNLGLWKRRELKIRDELRLLQNKKESS